MSTITTLAAIDNGAVSRTVINDNVTNLNTDKLETSVLDTDVNLAADSDSKVATQKATKAYVDSSAGDPISVETTTGVTHSLTTLAGQTVIVWAKGKQVGDTFLKYGGVQKDIFDPGTSDEFGSFALMYTEVPGAATADITVTSAGSLADVKIIVQIIG